MDEARLRGEFDHQGYVVFRQFFHPEIVTGVRAEVEEMVDEHAQKLKAEGKIADVLDDEPLETRLHRLHDQLIDEAPGLYRAELHRPRFFGFFFHPGLLDVAELFLGGEIRLYPNYSMRPKLPEGTRVLWHQDGGYTEAMFQASNVDSLRMVNVWSPLVPATVENGCMRFVPGTHKLGPVPHEKRGRGLEIAQEHLQPVLSQAVPIELDPGDIVVFHNMLFHEGLPNHSKIIRWSLDWRYQDATQPTLRPLNGHIARSRSDPGSTIKTAGQWAQLTFS